MERVNPETGDEEEVFENLFAVLLGCLDDIREAGAVKKKLYKAGVRWETKG